MRHFQWLTLCASQVVAATLVSSTLAATDTSSANYVVPGCRDFISSNSVTPAYPFVQGFCAGVIQGLIYDRTDICLPSGVEKGQAVRIVVQYINSQPARLHEDFTMLAAEALRKAWPCQR